MLHRTRAKLLSYLKKGGSGMNASHILDALETIDDKYIVEAKERSFINITKSSRSMKRMQTLVAVIAALLLLADLPLTS